MQAEEEGNAAVVGMGAGSDVLLGEGGGCRVRGEGGRTGAEVAIAGEVLRLDVKAATEEVFGL